jgi:hypothetical protein
MKANVPRAWENLPHAQRKRIEEYALKIAREQNEKDGRIMLDLYIKMVCVTLHDAFGFGEKRLTMFIGNHRRLFKRQCRMVQDNTQIEYLNQRMAEIFKKNGFPQHFFDEMLGAVEDPSGDQEGETDGKN